MPKINWKLYQEKVKEIRRKYIEQFKHMPTKAQALAQRKEELRDERDSSWSKYLEEIKPRISAMPYGTFSVRRSLISLEKAPKQVIKPESGRGDALKRLIEAQRPIVIHKRKVIKDWCDNVIPNLITADNLEDSINRAMANPCNPNVPIQKLVADAIAHKHKVRSIQVHTEDIASSVMIEQVQKPRSTVN